MQDTQTLSSNTTSEMKVIAGDWITVCTKNDLVENSGVCALLPAHLVRSDAKIEDNLEVQIAIFYIKQINKVFAISNYDPIGKANVMYRGIVGSISDEPMVSSPLYKQHFSLETGKCFEKPEYMLRTYLCRIQDNLVQVKVGSTNHSSQ